MIQAPTPVVEYITPVFSVFQAPTPVVESIAPVSVVFQAPVFPFSPDASDTSSPEDEYTRSWESLPVPVESFTQVESAEPLNLASETPTVFSWSRTSGWSPRWVGGSCPVASQGRLLDVGMRGGSSNVLGSFLRYCGDGWRGLAVRAFWSGRLGGSGAGNEREEDEYEWHRFWRGCWGPGWL